MATDMIRVSPLTRTRGPLNDVEVIARSTIYQNHSCSFYNLLVSNSTRNNTSIPIRFLLHLLLPKDPTYLLQPKHFGNTSKPDQACTMALQTTGRCLCGKVKVKPTPPTNTCLSPYFLTNTKPKGHRDRQTPHLLPNPLLQLHKLQTPLGRYSLVRLHHPQTPRFHFRPDAQVLHRSGHRKRQAHDEDAVHRVRKPGLHHRGCESRGQVSAVWTLCRRGRVAETAGRVFRQG